MPDPAAPKPAADTPAPVPSASEEMAAAVAEVSGIIQTSLKEVLQGSTEDLVNFGNRIAQDIVIAASMRRPALVEELKAQVKLLAEINRLRISQEAQATAVAVIDRMFTALIKVATAAVLLA